MNSFYRTSFYICSNLFGLSISVKKNVNMKHGNYESDVELQGLNMYKTKKRRIKKELKKISKWLQFIKAILLYLV